MNGEIDTERASRAILTHRNTPNQKTGVSPSEVLFGYKIRDHLPNKFQKTRREWKEIMTSCNKKIEKSREHPKAGKHLSPLEIGDRVRIQNQVGSCPKKWNNTGKVIEVKPFRQYIVLPDGNKRATLRNRKFLKKEIKTQQRNIPSTPIENHLPTAQTMPQKTQELVQIAKRPDHLPKMEDTIPKTTIPTELHEGNLNDNTPEISEEAEVQPNLPASSHQHGTPNDGAIRRSTRQRKQIKRLIEEV